MERLGAFKPEEQGKLRVLSEWLTLKSVYSTINSRRSDVEVVIQAERDAREAMDRVMAMPKEDTSVLVLPYKIAKVEDPKTARYIYNGFKNAYPDRIGEVRKMFGVKKKTLHRSQ